MRNAMVLSIQESEHINLDTKKPTTVEHLERLPHDLDVAIDAEDVEIQLHLRTWLTLVAFWLLNYVQVVALQGPTAVVSICDASSEEYPQLTPPDYVETIVDIYRKRSTQH